MMISYEDFKELFFLIPGEPEFELWFGEETSEYMIIKYDDHVSFQRCGYLDGSGEFDYESLDALYHEELVDGIRLDKDWEQIKDIVVDSTWNLSFEDDIEDLKSVYLPQ